MIEAIAAVALRVSIRPIAQIDRVAAPVLKQDTIPKPDGLGLLASPADIERGSDDSRLCSTKIEGRSIAFES
jgi:hypothetical protein